MRCNLHADYVNQLSSGVSQSTPGQTFPILDLSSSLLSSQTKRLTAQNLTIALQLCIYGELPNTDGVALYLRPFEDGHQQVGLSRPSVEA